MKNFWENKKVVVTGASGFVGSHVIDALLKKGAVVTAVVSSKTKKEKIKQNLGHNLKQIILKKENLLGLKDCLKITRGQQIVLNFAAMDGGVYFKMNNPAKIFRINTQIILNMLEASKQNKVDKFLLTSSIEVYPGNLPSRVNEEYGFREGLDEKTEGYSWSKRFGEIAARMYYKEHSLNIAIARLGNVYGPRDYSDKEKGRVIPTFIMQSIQGKDIVIVGDGMQERAFLYVTDLSEALLKLTERYAVCDPVNVAGSNYITIKDLARLIINMIGKNNNLIFEKSDTSFSRKRKISVAKARKLIRLKEKESIETGLQKTINFFSKASVE